MCHRQRNPSLLAIWLLFLAKTKSVSDAIERTIFTIEKWFPRVFRCKLRTTWAALPGNKGSNWRAKSSRVPLERSAFRALSAARHGMLACNGIRHRITSWYLSLSCRGETLRTAPKLRMHSLLRTNQEWEIEYCVGTDRSSTMITHTRYLLHAIKRAEVVLRLRASARIHAVGAAKPTKRI